MSNCLYLEFGEKPTPLNVNFSDFSFLVKIFFIIFNNFGIAV